MRVLNSNFMESHVFISLTHRRNPAPPMARAWSTYVAEDCAPWLPILCADNTVTTVANVVVPHPNERVRQCAEVRNIHHLNVHECTAHTKWGCSQVHTSTKRSFHIDTLLMCTQCFAVVVLLFFFFKTVPVCINMKRTANKTKTKSQVKFCSSEAVICNSVKTIVNKQLVTFVINVSGKHYYTLMKPT